MLVKVRLKRFLMMIVLLAVIAALAILMIDLYIDSKGSKYLSSLDEVPKADAIIVFGAYVFPDGTVCRMLADRLDYGYELYKAQKALRIIVSGDHSTTAYDEVNAMREYLQSKGVPREDIFMDHAGFSTYETLYRARDIFVVDKAILVSQEYHLVRALYIAEKLGLEAYGVASDPRAYPDMQYYRIREVGARCKAFMQAGIFKPEPTFLGDTIPIWKDGNLTDDGKS